MIVWPGCSVTRKLRSFLSVWGHHLINTVCARELADSTTRRVHTFRCYLVSVWGIALAAICSWINGSGYIFVGLPVMRAFCWLPGSEFHGSANRISVATLFCCVVPSQRSFQEMLFGENWFGLGGYYA